MQLKKVALWFETITSNLVFRFANVLKKDGYKECQADHTLSVKRAEEGKIMAIIVYIDDIVLTGNH